MAGPGVADSACRHAVHSAALVFAHALPGGLARINPGPTRNGCPPAGPRKSHLKAVPVPSRLAYRPADTRSASPTGDARGDMTAADYIEAAGPTSGRPQFTCWSRGATVPVCCGVDADTASGRSGSCGIVQVLLGAL